MCVPLGNVILTHSDSTDTVILTLLTSDRFFLLLLLYTLLFSFLSFSVQLGVGGGGRFLCCLFMACEVDASDVLQAVSIVCRCL